MSFTSVLKAIGQGAVIAAREIAVIEGFAPVVMSMLPQTPKVTAIEGQVDLTLSRLHDLVQQIEVMGAPAADGQPPNMTGPEKLQAASALVMQLLITAGHFANHDVGDPVLVKKGVTGLVQGIVDIQNGLKA